MPALQGAVDDLIEAGVTGGSDAAIQDVRDAVVEIADSDDAIGGRGSADVMPTGIGAVADRIEAGSPLTLFRNSIPRCRWR